MRAIFFLFVFLAQLQLIAFSAGDPPLGDDPCHETNNNGPMDITNQTVVSTTCCALGYEDGLDFPSQECNGATDGAKIWFTILPDGLSDGYYVEVSSEKVVGIEVFSGNESSGCMGTSFDVIDAACSVTSAQFKIPSCHSMIWISVVSSKIDCGEVTISATSDQSGIGLYGASAFNDTLIETIFPNTQLDGSFNFQCFNSSLTYACPNSGIGNCGFNNIPTVWFKVDPDFDASQIYFNVQTECGWDPVFALYEEIDGEISIVTTAATPACNTGWADPSQINQPINTVPQAHYIAIGANHFEPNMCGDFQFCLTTVVTQIICLGDGSCTPAASFQTYDEEGNEFNSNEAFICPGSSITVCTDFFYDASETGVDWLAGITPTFVGWDQSDFDPNSVLVTGNGMQAEWYDSNVLQEYISTLCTYTDEMGVLQLCNILCSSCPCSPGLPQESTLPGGWYWVSNGGNAGCDNDGTPGEGWGIGSTQATVDFCIDLRVPTFENQEECLANRNLSFGFQTFSDGVAGCWEDAVGECLLDEDQFVNFTVSCQNACVGVITDLKEVHGHIYYDMNENDIRDDDDFYVRNEMVELKDQYLFGVTDDMGRFSIKTDMDTGIVSLVDLHPFWNLESPIDNQQGYEVDSSGIYEYADFEVSNNMDCDYLTLSHHFEQPRVCVETNIKTRICNGGFLPSSTFVLEVVLSDIVEIIEASMPYEVSNDTLIFTFDELQTGDCITNSITIKTICDEELTLENVCISKTLISETNCNDDTEYFNCIQAINSYDPNQILGFIEDSPNCFFEDQGPISIDYQIDFQNIGTADALDVVIRNTLDDNFDIRTFKFQMASHDYDLEIIDGRTLSWTFKNINLPDSLSEPELSKGFVRYSIESFTAQMDTIDNQAAIYFDFNAPVITNKHLILHCIDEDGDGTISSFDCDDSDPSINPDMEEIPNNAIDEDCDGIALMIDEDGDGYNSDEDCDDMNVDINPGAEEIVNNEIDEDCDGEVALIDEDGDGYNSDEDCDDMNVDINPGAEEIPNNEVDEDCDGEALVIDEDGDGYNSDEDCDDANADINPGAAEIANNEVDEDCDGEALVIDEDGDGYNSDEDCDDANADINPGAEEIANNEVDEDCDGEALVIDEDGDGYNNDEDCNDMNADINPGAEEIPNNAIDEDCNGENLIIDEDGDGYNSDEDCDDTNADINPGAEEIPNNAIDEDCNGENLIIDEDGDGYNSDEDCDDTNADINPGAEEIANNGIDEDCNGEDLISANQTLSLLGLTIYPNPASSIVYLGMDKTASYQVILYDITGQKVLEKENVVQLDVSMLNIGTYLLKLIDLSTMDEAVQRLAIVH